MSSCSKSRRLSANNARARAGSSWSVASCPSCASSRATPTRKPTSRQCARLCSSSSRPRAAYKGRAAACSPRLNARCPSWVRAPAACSCAPTALATVSVRSNYARASTIAPCESHEARAKQRLRQVGRGRVMTGQEYRQPVVSLGQVAAHHPEPSERLRRAPRRGACGTKLSRLVALTKGVRAPFRPRGPARPWAGFQARPAGRAPHALPAGQCAVLRGDD